MKTEGRNAVVELLKTNKNIDKLLLEKGAQGSLGLIFAEARKKNLRVQFVDKQVLDKESETRRHQGVIAFTTDYEYYDLDEIIAEKKSEKGGFVVIVGRKICPLLLRSARITLGAMCIFYFSKSLSNGSFGT
mgnify:CR=1 FL=1